MKKLILGLITLFPLQVFALQLRVGDLLLQPRNCWSCTLIEQQERTIYSHMGMVIQTQPEIKVVEALGTVRILSLQKFNEGTEKGQRISVRRFVNQDITRYLETNKSSFLNFFIQNFNGLEYDHDFLWNNMDDQGNEKLYCSEMVAKLFHAFLGIEVPVKRMKYDINRDKWIQYFKGNPPDGKWGNAPADFEKSQLFYEVGDL